MEKFEILRLIDEGRSEGGRVSGAQHSVVKNHDKAVLELLKNVSVPRVINRMGLDWTLEDAVGEEVRGTSGKNVFYFDKKDVDEVLREKRIRAMKKAYHPAKAFNQQYGTLYKTYFREVTKDSLYERKHVAFSASVFIGYRESVVENDERLSDWGGYTEDNFGLFRDFESFRLECRRWSTLCFLEYDEDGNFVNRDYNVDLPMYTQQAPDFEIMKTEAIKFIEGMEATIASGNVFFGENFCYDAFFYNSGDDETEFRIERIPFRNMGKNGPEFQKGRGAKIYKLGKNYEQVTKDDIKERIFSKFLNPFWSKNEATKHLAE
jgi:hypothetical protein